MAANISGGGDSTFGLKDVKSFYLNVKRGDFLRYPCWCSDAKYPPTYKTKDNCHFHFGVFFDEPGLYSTSHENIVHFPQTPNRVERSFLLDVSKFAKQNEDKLSIFAAVRHFDVKPFAVNSADELFNALDSAGRVEIINDLDSFWDIMQFFIKKMLQNVPRMGEHHKAKKGVGKMVTIV